MATYALYVTVASAQVETLSNSGSLLNLAVGVHGSDGAISYTTIAKKGCYPRCQIYADNFR